jgi:hypothetical protein
MKKNLVILVVLLITFISCSKSTKTNYCYLNGPQLKQLGVLLSNQGVYYKNKILNFEQTHERYPYIGFYSTDDIYLNSILYKENDTLKVSNKYDSIFIGLPSTNFDFYPILIGNTKGEYSLKKNFNNEKLFPVAIFMSETKLPKRIDTLVIWFKPTEMLQKALPGEIKMNDYLSIPTVKE